MGLAMSVEVDTFTQHTFAYTSEIDSNFYAVIDKKYFYIFKDLVANYSCDCNSGWTDMNCNADVDECSLESVCFHGSCRVSYINGYWYISVAYYMEYLLVVSEHHHLFKRTLQVTYTQVPNKIIMHI